MTADNTTHGRSEGPERQNRNLLTLTGIVKRFPGVEALKKVDFHLQAGEIVSLIGENGAGKSTLMSVIGGIYEPEEGEIHLRGRKINLENPAAAKRNGIGYVHQEPTLVPHMTGTENLFLGQEKTSRWLITDSDGMRREAEKILEEIGISFDPEKPVTEMSMAEKEAVEIAKAMLQKPGILILDEVTAPLDQVGVRKLFQVIRRLKSSGIGIIFISHRLREIFEISDRIVVLRDGELVGTLKPENSDQDELIRLMIGSAKVIRSATHRTSHGPKTEELLRCEELSCNGRVRKVNLTLSRGEIVGLAGLKGAGRSLLGMTLFGLAEPDGGRILVKGGQVSIGSPGQAMSLGIGYIPKDRQHQGLALIRNVEENSNITLLDRFASALGLLNRRSLNENAQRVVSQLQVKTPSLKQLVNYLSGGNQQKVMIGKWLTRGLEILIIDEPTRGVDVKSKADIHNLLIELRNQGLAIIVISSELPELLSLSDRILVMNQGLIREEIPGSEGTEERCLQCMHVAQEEVPAGVESQA